MKGSNKPWKKSKRLSGYGWKRNLSKTKIYTPKHKIMLREAISGTQTDAWESLADCLKRVINSNFFLYSLAYSYSMINIRWRINDGLSTLIIYWLWVKFKEKVYRGLNNVMIGISLVEITVTEIEEVMHVDKMKNNKSQIPNTKYLWTRYGGAEKEEIQQMLQKW